MGELVVYKNELNTVPLRNFNSKEMDLFFGICAKMRDEGLNVITFTFEQLRELSDYKYTAHDRFIADIESIYDKLIKLDIKVGTSTEFTKFVLFTKFSVSAKNETVNVGVNYEFKDILNQITGNFTKFELEEFTNLISSYSKTAYRLLKQYRKTGYVVFEIDDFRRLFDIPSKYKMGNIDQKVLKPIKEELGKVFKGFEINKISKCKGRKITHIEFIFQAESDFKENGKKTFIDKDGFYYDKTFDELTEDEIKKEYPNVPQPQADKYYK